MTSSASGSTPAMRFAATKSVRTSKPGARRSCSAGYTPRCIHRKRRSSAAHMPSFEGTGTRSGPSSSTTREHGTLQAKLRGWTCRCRSIRPGPVGPAAAGPVHVGLRADGQGMSEALFVLLGLAHRRPEAAAARGRQRGRRDHRAPSSGLPVRGAGGRQLLSGHAGGSRHGGTSEKRGAARTAADVCEPSDSS